MSNQDLVAKCLMRVPIDEMHRAITRHSNNTLKYEQRDVIAADASTTTLIEQHGWTLDEYAEECYKLLPFYYNLHITTPERILVFSWIHTQTK